MTFTIDLARAAEYFQRQADKVGTYAYEDDSELWKDARANELRAKWCRDRMTEAIDQEILEEEQMEVA